MAANSKVSSKEKRIRDITEMLASGMERKNIVQKIAKTCKVSARTIDNEIKAAKEALSKRNDLAESIRLAATKQMTEEAIRAGLKSDLELEVILCQIAGGNVQVAEWVKGMIVLRDTTPTEITNAIKTIYVKRGSNAPTKTALTDTAGKDIDLSKSPVIFR